MSKEGVVLGARFQEALLLATSLHTGQSRKGTQIPYVAHLFAVCALVLGDGGTEDEAIGALLHDALEDHPDEIKAADIERLFGSAVMRIVLACTDTGPSYVGGPKPPWHERKLGYLEHIRGAGPEGLRVSLADKLDNARAIVADYREVGDALWSRFNAGKEQQLWYYGELVQAFRAAGVQSRMLGELDSLVSELNQLVS